MAIKSIEVDCLLYHILKLAQTIRKVAKLGSVRFVEGILVILIHDTFEGANKPRQANNDLVGTDDILQIGLASLKSL